MRHVQEQRSYRFPNQGIFDPPSQFPSRVARDSPYKTLNRTSICYTSILLRQEKAEVDEGEAEKLAGTLAGLIRGILGKSCVRREQIET